MRRGAVAVRRAIVIDAFAQFAAAASCFAIGVARADTLIAGRRAGRRALPVGIAGLIGTAAIGVGRAGLGRALPVGAARERRHDVVDSHRVPGDQLLSRNLLSSPPLRNAPTGTSATK